MTTPSPFPDPEHGVDALVRAHLEAEASRTDAGSLWKKVLHRLSQDAAVQPRRRWQRQLAGVLAVASLAAALMIAVFTVSPQRQLQASPTEVVQAARAVVVPWDTRCYSLKTTLPAPLRESLSLAAGEPPTRTLCTRGDRFVVEPGFGGKGAYGKMPDGRLWVAPTANAAAVFDDSELPQPLRDILKIQELELDVLLDDVLADFSIAWSEPLDPKADTYLISASRRSPVPGFRIDFVELVIEKETKTIRSLNIYRRLQGDNRVTTVFTLLELVTKDDSFFTPEGHLKPGAPILDRTKPMLRRRFIRNHFGNAMGN